MSAPAVLAPELFEERLARFLFERSEEARAVRVGEKGTSEQAAIIAQYADLFTQEQHEVLREAEARAAHGAEEEECERLFRLREACAGGIIASELAERSDALENAVLACTVEYGGERLPLRAAQARLAVLESYSDRDRLGKLVAEASATLNGERLELLAAAEALDAELSGEADPVVRSSRRKQVDLYVLASALEEASAAIDGRYVVLRARWLDRLLGPEREDQPASAHVSYVRRLSPLAATYTKERAVPVSLATLEVLGFDLAADERIRLDLDDRPQKNPRACVIASDPPRVVHLITRAQGGLSDYQAFLHEAGHALHYASCDPALPYAFRRLARDHALTELYSFLVESVTHEQGWHAQHFGLDEARAAEHAEATRFLDALLFRRYTAKLRYELGLWSDFANAEAHASEYERLVSGASGFRYPRSGYLADMDDGFYSADYLRAWIRAAQARAFLRSRVGPDWWRSVETGRLLRELFAQGTLPSSEGVAARLGYDPLDVRPLVVELGADDARV